MLFTRASEYALLASIYLRDKNEPKDVGQIAEELNISKAFLAKILQCLARDGILNSTKGANGGFCLAKDANEIKITSIIKSAEKHDASVFLCSGDLKDCPRGIAQSCDVWHLFASLQAVVDNFLDTITLANLGNKENKENNA